MSVLSSNETTLVYTDTYRSLALTAIIKFRNPKIDLRLYERYRNKSYDKRTGRHILKMSARVFNSWLRLLDEAWTALDAHARRTLNALVRMSLTKQPLPENRLTLEMLGNESDSAPVGMSQRLTGWSVSDCDSNHSEGRVATVLAEQKDD